MSCRTSSPTLSDWASLEYVGPAAGWDQEVVRGSIDDGEFTIFYLDDGRVVAALTVGRSDDLEHAGRLLASARGHATSRARARGPLERPRGHLAKRATELVRGGGSAALDDLYSAPEVSTATHSTGEWCNGSTRRSGRRSWGSSPCSPVVFSTLADLAPRRSRTLW